MVTGAALATVNRLPVLLLPGDVFATRRVDPVLQQLEAGWSRDVSVNDSFRPVSRYWDRINRPEQLGPALLEAMRVLTDPAETGAVTLCLPQDVQAEAYDFPIELVEPRTWHIGRPLPDRAALDRAVAMIRSARAPLIVAGGGVHHSDATDALRAFAEQTGVPVAETQAGKGALPYGHPLALGAIGATGTRAANLVARDADLVLGVGTRYADFTTASRTAFQHTDVQVVNVNVGARDAAKLGGCALVGDARATLELLGPALAGHHVSERHEARARVARGGVGRRGRSARRRSRGRAPDAGTGDRGGQRRRRRRRASWSAPQAACRATSTSCGDLATRWRTTSSTATRAWATRWREDSACASPSPTARSS